MASVPLFTLHRKRFSSGFAIRTNNKEVIQLDDVGASL